MRYNNYHKHCHESNVRTIDCIVKIEDYMARIKELGHNTYFTGEHGWAGNYLNAYDICKKNAVKMVYGAELYIVKDRLEKDNTNAHIMIVAKNKSAFKQLNKIMSESNVTGFYYKNRIDLDLIKQLNPKDFFITSACVGGVAKYDLEDFILPLHAYFGNNFYLETQAHPHPIQVAHNQKVLEISKQLGISIIHANDSHYIYPEQAKDRDLFLKGKGLRYDEEDGFVLDYPDAEAIIQRYKTQGILNDSQIKQALENTLIFDECEDLMFDKEIKMPKLYPNEDSNKKLQNIIQSEWNKERLNVNQDKLKEYKEAIRFEYDIIEKTNMADYFILDYEIVKRAKEEYNAVLSRTGRGSAVSFYTNKLLGFTEIDRLESPITLYSTRFMSIARILESKSLPDIDLNWADVEPVIKASKDILGEDGVYYMVAFGTMKESAAFRNLCRAYNLEMNEYNEVAKNLEAYVDDYKWGKLIEESKKFIGVIDSVSPSPCSFLLLDKPISEEIGLIKVGDKICACIDGITSDTWKYLKNDYLTVSVWTVISETFKLINKPIPDIKELTALLDDKVWNLYEKGLTATLNQADTDFATNLFMKYKPKSVAETSAMVAAIRPGFASLLDTFIHRKWYSTGVKELDELLKDSLGFLLYQESLMKYFVWLGIAEDITYDIIKKVAKKKFKDKELEELKENLLKGWMKVVGVREGFNETWQVIEDAAFYSFNASHSLSVALDSLYGAYLKANYPLEYYTVALNHFGDDIEKTDKIIQELSSFEITLNPIKFGYSKGGYFFDKETNSIYKGVGSIKFLNEAIGEQLYSMKDEKIETFKNLLVHIGANTSINSKQLAILTSLDFFDSYAKSKKLLKFTEMFDEVASAKSLSKDKAEKLNITHIVEKYSRATAKKYNDLQMDNILDEIWNSIPNQDLNPKEKIKAELEFLGYANTRIPELHEQYAVVMEINTKYKNPVITMYRPKTGDTEKLKIKKKVFDSNPFEVYDMIKTIERNQQNKWAKTQDGFTMLEEKEWYLTKWIVIDF